MHTSTYFHDLYSAYQAELDDLTSDSEGKDVLRKRLNEKRKELGFLLKMIEISPEMVVVVLHQAFRFTLPAVMDHVLARESDDLPQWESISGSIEVAPWAQDMVQTILKEPMGEWFMTIACALEYLHNKPLTPAERAHLAAQIEEEDLDEVRNERHDDNHTEDHDEDEAQARSREEAGNDWMVEQGFDRKE